MDDFEDEFNVESLISIAQNLEVTDISNNRFDGDIEIAYFEACSNVEYIPGIQDLCINNNEINVGFEVSYFTSTLELRIFECHNNSLRNGKLDMVDTPQRLKIFDCGFNDCGEIFWNALSIKGAGIYGIITIAFFNDSEIEYLELNISVDFDDLANDKNINLLMNENTLYVDSYCGGCKRFIDITKCTFNIIRYYLFMLQIWDLCSDGSFEHDKQASVDNSRLDIFETYMIFCGMLVSSPFIANLAFSEYWTLKLSNTDGYHDNNTVTSQVAQEWVQNHAYVFGLCFFLVSLTASLKMVNSHLFGLKYCSMGISKNKQEETVGFGIALLGVFLSFLKHYHFYGIQITLQKGDSYNVGMVLTMKLEFKNIICKRNNDLRVVVVAAVQK